MYLHLFIDAKNNPPTTTGEGLRQQVKLEIDKLPLGTKQDPTFPCLSFSLLSPVM